MDTKKAKKSISKTKIEKALRRKFKPELKQTVIKLKKQNNEFWLNIAKLLSRPRRKKIAVNLSTINAKTSPNDIVLVPGKVLGNGMLKHNITLACLEISAKAKQKIKDKAKLVSILELLESKPNIEKIKVIT